MPTIQQLVRSRRIQINKKNEITCACKLSTTKRCLYPCLYNNTKKTEFSYKKSCTCSINFRFWGYCIHSRNWS